MLIVPPLTLTPKHRRAAESITAFVLNGRAVLHERSRAYKCPATRCSAIITTSCLPSTALLLCLAPGFEGVSFTSGWKEALWPSSSRESPNDRSRPSSDTAELRQRSEGSLRALARRHGVNPKTIAKWRKRSTTADLPAGPKDPRSTSLTVVAVAGPAYRRRGADRSQVIDIGSGSVLRTTIRVADETGRGSLPLCGHHQRRERQLGAHMVAHGQPTILRVARSSTAARYSQPSPVAM